LSSTNRGHQKERNDFYPTPAWCVRRLLEQLFLPSGRWLEPGAGEGAIIKATARSDIKWTALELRPSCRRSLELLIKPSQVFIGDYLASAKSHPLGNQHFDVVLANPPFTSAMEFVQESLRRASTVVMLLRLNFLATGKRSEFMRTHCPDVYVLPDRPSFTGKGTDSIEYGWFVWKQGDAPRGSGHLSVLASTPAYERRYSRKM
jgi:hypothetical protein